MSTRFQDSVRVPAERDHRIRWKIRRTAMTAHPQSHLAGVLQVDGYAGFNALVGERKGGAVQFAFCLLLGE
jgi:hypothetical protein